MILSRSIDAFAVDKFMEFHNANPLELEVGYLAAFNLKVII